MTILDAMPRKHPRKTSLTEIHLGFTQTNKHPQVQNGKAVNNGPCHWENWELPERGSELIFLGDSLSNNFPAGIANRLTFNFGNDTIAFELGRVSSYLSSRKLAESQLSTRS